MKFTFIEDDIPLIPVENGGNYATTHELDEGSDGLHAWTARKPPTVDRNWPGYKLDFSITADEGAAMYATLVDAYIAGATPAGYKSDDLFRDLADVHKRKKFHVSNKIKLEVIQ